MTTRHPRQLVSYIAPAAPADARRAVMYTPMDLGRKSTDRIRSDLSRIVRELGPSDVVFADVEAAAPDRRILDVIDHCRRISEEYGSRREKRNDDEYGDSA
jgi:hypothetical protein